MPRLIKKLNVPSDTTQAINKILSMGLLYQYDNRLGHGASDTDLSLVVLS